MPHIWSEGDEGQWPVSDLDGSLYSLHDSRVQPLTELPAGSGASDSVALCTAHAGGERWALLAGSAARVSVNGNPVTLGIRHLRDRDEILLRSGDASVAWRFFFSTEMLACVQPLPAGVTASCPRCKDPLEPGQPAVRCPACCVWHHQNEQSNRPCWTYSELCAACNNQATALDAGFRWTPEEL